MNNDDPCCRYSMLSDYAALIRPTNSFTDTQKPDYATSFRRNALRLLTPYMLGSWVGRISAA